MQAPIRFLIIVSVASSACKPRSCTHNSVISLDVIGLDASRNVLSTKRFTLPFWALCFVTYSFIARIVVFGSNNRMQASR